MHRRPVPDALRGRPFRRAEAIACKVTDDDLRGTSYRRLLRGVYVASDVPDTLELRCDAVALILPRADFAFSHSTAAQLYGAPVRPSLDVHVTVGPGVTVPARRGWLRPHEGLPPSDVALWRGRRVTAPELTWLQLAETLSLDELVCVGDFLVRRTAATPATLAAAVGAADHRRGVRRSRAAVTLVRERVDSPQETRTRLLLVRAGLPEPEVGLDARDDGGGWIARPDLSYPAYKIAIEYDGAHHASIEQWEFDVERDRVYADHGWLLIRVTRRTLREFPERVVRRVAAALRERGYSGPLPC